MDKSKRQLVVILYTCIPSIIIFTWRQAQNFPEDSVIKSFILFLILIPIVTYVFRGLVCDLMSEEHPEKVGICRIIILTIFYGYLINVGINNNQFRTCYDKTSIDYNWQNDMKCINKKGEIKRTDYEGAKRLMGK